MDLQTLIDSVCEHGRELFTAVFPSYTQEYNSRMLHTMIEGARYMQVPVCTYERPVETRARRFRPRITSETLEEARELFTQAQILRNGNWIIEDDI